MNLAARCSLDGKRQFGSDALCVPAQMVDGGLADANRRRELVLCPHNRNSAANVMSEIAHRASIAQPIAIGNRQSDDAGDRRYWYDQTMTLADNLRRAMQAKGLSQSELARRAGVSQPTINGILSGDQQTSRKLGPIAKALGMNVWDLDPTLLDPHQPPGPVAPTPPLASNYRAPVAILGARDLPIYSAVEGGPGEVVVSTDPIDLVPRPWYMGEVRDGYGVVVVGESMVPVYEPGDIVIVNPRLPPMKGKHHILIQDDGNGSFVGTIKKVVGWTADEWRLEQYNPPPGQERQFTLAKAEWAKALRVVGKYEGG